MKKLLFSSILILACYSETTAQSQPAYLDDSKPIEERVEDALSRMTLEEKISVTHAQSKFSSPGVPRLGIPEFWMSDGPHGIRPEVMWNEWRQAGWTNDSCMAFPALTCLAATWNPDVAHLYGKSIGEEARYRNKTVLLGPGVNIYRTPLNGRNFEYMGEDPYLASKMVVPYVKGVQENGVAACVKHFALNNQESSRFSTNVIVDDRTLYEIYLPAFKAAVMEGKAWAIMGAYNLYKNQHCCQNQYLLKDILKGEWKFDGVVISDWGGTHDTEEAARHGLDMEFGTSTNGMSSKSRVEYDGYYLAQPYKELILKGQIGTEELDDKVRRILRLAYRTNMKPNRPLGALCSDAHMAAARKIAEEGIVLLKNEKNILPIDLKKAHKIAVIGENAIKMMTVGGGSSSLKVKYELSPLEGIKRRLGKEAEVVYARGYVGDTTTEFDGVKTGQNLKDRRSTKELRNEAVALAKQSDYVIFIGGLNKSGHQDSEGNDRYSLDLPYHQDKLIAELAKVSKRFIVVNVSGNAVAMPWVKDVPAIVQTWFLGSEAGNALAAVLAGDVNPSGKLPFTFPHSLNEVGAHKLGAYPGVQRTDGSNLIDEIYKEGLFVGYRWTCSSNIEPLFPFGHGLSYTTFKYGKAETDKKVFSKDKNDQLIVRIPVTNVGQRAGAEVVQLYIKDVKSSLPRPVMELKGFQKIYLQPGETKEVSFVVKSDALQFFNDQLHTWVVESGQFEAIVAASATDVKSCVSFEVN